MADKKPLRVVFTGETPTALGEFQSGDTIPIENGGTGGTTAEEARQNLSAAAEEHDHSFFRLPQSNTHEVVDTDQSPTSIHHTLGTGAGQACAGDDARLSDAREWTAVTVAQAEAEAGTATTRRAWTAQRVFQSIGAWWNASAAKSKLDGIATGATANSTDAQLRDRSTHTGTQAHTTVTGLGNAATLNVGTAAGTVCAGNDSRLSNARTPTSHTHGNLTNDGKIGSAAGVPLITGANGVVQAGSFGTASGTYCQGNDSRLSDARTPTAHKTTHEAGGSDVLLAENMEETGFPTIRPTLDLNFAGSQRVDPRVTFTRASSATYFDAKGIMRTAAANEPRIDFDPMTGECRGLLIEEARTNLLTYSQEFDNAAWEKAKATVTANAATAPDGTTTADKLVEGAIANAFYLMYTTTFTSGQPYTVSIFAKDDPLSAQRYLILHLRESAFGEFISDIFNLRTGEIEANNSGTALIEHIADGWYRCSVTKTATATITTTGFWVRLGNSDSAIFPSYTGDGTSGIYIWGAQLEAGAFPTSYIPTATAAATRAADVAVISGTTFSDFYRHDEGSFLWVGKKSETDVTATTNRLFTVSDGTISNTYRPYFTTSDTPALASTSGGTVNSQLSGSVVGSEITRVVFAMKNNDAALSHNGTVVTTTSVFSVPVGVHTLELGRYLTQSLCGYINRFAFFPKKLPNATLKQLTKP